MDVDTTLSHRFGDMGNNIRASRNVVLGKRNVQVTPLIHKVLSEVTLLMSMPDRTAGRNVLEQTRRVAHQQAGLKVITMVGTASVVTVTP